MKVHAVACIVQPPYCLDSGYSCVFLKKKKKIKKYCCCCFSVSLSFLCGQYSILDGVLIPFFQMLYTSFALFDRQTKPLEYLKLHGCLHADINKKKCSEFYFGCSNICSNSIPISNGPLQFFVNVSVRKLSNITFHW